MTFSIRLKPQMFQKIDCVLNFLVFWWNFQFIAFFRWIFGKPWLLLYSVGQNRPLRKNYYSKRKSSCRKRMSSCGKRKFLLRQEDVLLRQSSNFFSVKEKKIICDAPLSVYKEGGDDISKRFCSSFPGCSLKGSFLILPDWFLQGINS